MLITLDNGEQFDIFRFTHMQYEGIDKEPIILANLNKSDIAPILFSLINENKVFTLHTKGFKQSVIINAVHIVSVRYSNN